MTRLVEGTEGELRRGKIFAAIELSKSKWVVGIRLPHIEKVSLFEIDGGEVDRLLGLFDRARATVVAQGWEPTEICSCYEAGYDGFWLHHLLVSRGIRNSVLDSASIQVSRRRRRLKTDRTDAESLIRVFMAWHRGERQACSIVRVPSPEEEDAKRLHRSRANLLRERVRHVNRIRGLLHLQGVVHIHPHREGWTAALRGLETRDGRRFPERLMSEIKREAKLLAVVKKLLREVDLELVALVRAQESTRRSPRTQPAHPIASKLARIRGIGPTLATVLASCSTDASITAGRSRATLGYHRRPTAAERRVVTRASARPETLVRGTTPSSWLGSGCVISRKAGSQAGSAIASRTLRAAFGASRLLP